MNTYIFIHGRYIELQMFMTGLEESVHACDRTGYKIDSWQCRVNIMSRFHKAYYYMLRNVFYFPGSCIVAWVMQCTQGILSFKLFLCWTTTFRFTKVFHFRLTSWGLQVWVYIEAKPWASFGSCRAITNPVDSWLSKIFRAECPEPCRLPHRGVYDM